MNLTQKLIFAMVMVELAGILVLSHVLVANYRGEGIAKFAIMASIFVASLLVPKLTKMHRVIGLAFIFVFIGDFFLVFLGTLPGISKDDLFVKIGGMIGFLGAYSTLIWLLTRKFSFGIKDILALLPVLVVLVPVMAILVPHISGPFLIFAVVFGLVVGGMAWNALCTVHRGYYTRKVAVRFAIAGFLMFFSDMGVAFVFFYPGMQSNVPWLENEIWITYVPAWTLILMNLLEQKLLSK
ncbi:MAG: hypothetical protein FJ013_08035 [Chloroflexi bacterium]|nr:hypothetical protein [Chloroflexota bacterium]MBM4454514.1 hypothetical protein [Chloroflexota bacterium]